MKRRLFLGLVGGTIAAAATPEIFSVIVQQHTPVLSPAWAQRLVMEVFFSCNEGGLYTVRRAGSERELFHPMWMTAGGMYRWVSVPGFEIVLLPDQPTLVIDGPGVDQWSMIWSEQKDDGMHRYSAGSTYPEPVSMTVGDTPIDVHDWLTHTDTAAMEAELFGLEYEPNEYELAGD